MIKNYRQLANSRQKKYALKILDTGIQSVLPENILQKIRYENKILTVADNNYKITGNIFVIGAGKASARMAKVVEDIIGVDNINAGFINSVEKMHTKKIKINVAGHPYPDINGINGTNKILNLKNEFSINKDDLILCLVSGGGSALLTLPEEGISLDDTIQLTKLLLVSGANIHEINSVRKHISKVKGGRLAEQFYPTKIISLIISDVIGNDLDVIASGPTVADKTTFKDAWYVIEKYEIANKIPNSINIHLQKGINDELYETPKQISNAYNYVIGDNKIALQSMKKQAEKLGLHTYILTSELQGEASEKAKEILKKIIYYKRPCAVLMGGETTVTLDKHGKGGRNQEYVLSSLIHSNIKGEWAIASLATDGSDYLKDVAGAIIDNNIQRNIDLIQYLENHDSYTILKKLNALIHTGNTGTNVCDLICYVLL